MILKDLDNKKIAILGLGLENYALIKYLLKKSAVEQIVIYEKKSQEEVERYKELSKSKKIIWRWGEFYPKDLSEFAFVFRSPGSIVHKDKKVKLGQAILTSALNLFFALCPTKNIIGITGTKGKGTTASLLYHILQTAKKRVWLGGNIGVAPFDFLEKIKKNDWVVLELSSFQLEDITASPHIGVLTNFFSEHLAPADPFNPNFHYSLQGYWQAKLAITSHQRPNDYLIVNRKLKSRLAKIKPVSRLIYFDKLLWPSQLAGQHNQENIAAAAAAAKLAGVKQSLIKRAVASFVGLEHRLELVRELRGVKYYNDSFATTPESAIIALHSFSQPIILLAGGADKGSNFKNLAKAVKQQVKQVILLTGRATPRLKRELLKVGYPSRQIIVFNNLKPAVKTAQEQAQIGEVVLLSPACASFGLFKNYKERGQLFKAAVKKLR